MPKVYLVRKCPVCLLALRKAFYYRIGSSKKSPEHLIRSAISDCLPEILSTQPKKQIIRIKTAKMRFFVEGCTIFATREGDFKWVDELCDSHRTRVNMPYIPCSLHNAPEFLTTHQSFYPIILSNRTIKKG